MIEVFRASADVFGDGDYIKFGPTTMSSRVWRVLHFDPYRSVYTVERVPLVLWWARRAWKHMKDNSGYDGYGR